jgi:hypothetical protein
VKRWFQVAFACFLIGAVCVLCVAPAYSVQPTALRAWTNSLTILAALCTLILFALAAPLLSLDFFVSEKSHRGQTIDRLRLTCTLLI